MSWFGDLLGGASDLVGSAASSLSNLGSSIGDWFGGGGTSGALGLGSLGSDAQGIDWGAAAQDATSGGLNFGAGLGSALSGLDLGSFAPSAVSGVLGGLGNGAGVPAGAGASPAGGLSGAQLGGAAGLAGKALAGGGGGAQQVAPQQQQQQPATLPAQAGGGGSSGGPGGLGSLLSGAGNFVENNPGTVLAGLMPLLSNYFKPSLPPQAQALQKQADDQMALVNNQLMPTALANQQGQINGQALNTIDASLQRQKAAMRKAYADMGMSGSTMEAQDLASLDQNAAQQVFATGQQMATTGLSTAASLSGQAGGWYNEVMQTQIQQDADLENAIAQVAAAAVSPRGNTTNVNTGGGQTGSGAGAVNNLAGLVTGNSAGGYDPLSGLLTSGPTPASPIDTTGMTPSPSGGLVVPGLTDPNAGTSGVDNIDWGNLGGVQAGGGQLIPGDLAQLAGGIDWSQLGYY